MTKKLIDEATVKLVLEALEKLNNTNSYWWQEVDQDVVVQLGDAETALKALAEQPAQQEPVAWLQIGLAPFHDGEVIARTTKPTKWNPEWWRFEPLYTTPQPAQQKPLTEEEFEVLQYKAKGYVHTGLMDVVRIVEHHHGIKENT